MVSIQVALLFIRSDGQGSHAPFAILFSWGILPQHYAMALGLVPSGLVVGLLLPVCYWVCLFSLTTFCARSSRPSISLSPLLIHTAGIMLALLAVTHNGWHGLDAAPGFLTKSYVAAGLLAGSYVLADWLLARKPTRGSARNGGPTQLLATSAATEELP